MPLVIVSGLPCSGKTTVSQKLKAFIEENYPSYKVCLLNEEALGIRKQDAYKNANEEKKARAGFMSAVERNVVKDTVVIADNLNYIKGYRYQLHCVSRAANTPHCAVYVLACIEEAKKRNEGRENKYSDTEFDELVMRFEEPNNQTKWDSPLFCIDSTSDDFPFETICKVICSEKTRRPPSLATTIRGTGSNQLISDLDCITQEVVDTVISKMKPFGPSEIQLDMAEVTIFLPKPMTIGDLASIRRQFIHMNRFHPLESSKIASLFTNYIISTLK